MVRLHAGLLPELEHVRAAGGEVAADRAEVREDVAVREEVAEAAEHVDRRIVRAAEVEAPHVPADERHRQAGAAGLRAREAQLGGGQVEARDLVPPPAEEERVGPGAAREVEDRGGLPWQVRPEDGLEEADVAREVPIPVEEVVELRGPFVVRHEPRQREPGAETPASTAATWCQSGPVHCQSVPEELDLQSLIGRRRVG